jgi:hypothetical protein
MTYQLFVSEIVNHFRLALDPTRRLVLIREDQICREVLCFTMVLFFIAARSVFFPSFL